MINPSKPDNFRALNCSNNFAPPQVRRKRSSRRNMAPILTTVLPMQLVCSLVATIGTDNVTQNAAINVGVIQQSSQREELVRELPEGYIADPDIGMAYKIHNETATRAAARRSCIDEGGRLAVVDSWEKHDYIKAHKTFNTPMHVGISKLEDSWVNVSNGSPVFSLPWATGEPEDERGYVCAYMGLSETGLAAGNCDPIELPYVCEISLLQQTENQWIPDSRIKLQ